MKIFTIYKTIHPLVNNYFVQKLYKYDFNNVTKKWELKRDGQGIPVRLPGDRIEQFSTKAEADVRMNEIKNEDIYKNYKLMMR